MRRILLGLTLAVFLLSGQQALFPLADLRPDMQGVARTVFRGQDSEEFPLQILGVLSNSGPGQSMILARLLTPRLEQTGVMQGMSGSPVYIQGKLVGAIAFAFPFAKEPIAGIRPIGEMLAVKPAPAASRSVAAIHLGSPELIAARPESSEGARFTEVLTPISFAGFTSGAIQHFASSWKQLGFALQQGASGNKPDAPATPLKPGDMISVQLLGGDMTVGADGTLTHIDGNKVYAFGHRFMGGGAVEFPFSKAEVITPLPNLNTSFKISQGLRPAGAILFDAEAAVSGEIGRKVQLTPIKIRYRDASGTQSYSIEMVRHAVLSPLLLQMAVYSCIDRNFRSAGVGTVDIQGTVRYPGTLPLHIEGRYAGDSNLPIAASLGAAIPMAFLQQQVVESILPESVEFDITAIPTRVQWAVERLSLSRRTAKPGDTVNIRTLLATPDGKEQLLNYDFRVPAWLTGGETLTVTIADSFTTNLLDFRTFYQPGGPTFRSASEMIETVNTLHPADTLFLRVLRSGSAYQSAARELSNLPTSIAAVMQKSPGAYQPTYQSRLASREFRLAEGVVSGSRTITLEIEK